MNKANYFKRSFATFLSEMDDVSHEQHGDRKRRLFSPVKGRVLEIGPGTGVNFRYLDSQVEWLGLEPNPAMHDFLYQAAKISQIQAELLEGASEEIPLDDHSVDFVISSEVLCSVHGLDKSLSEIRRVLKPGGQFLFIEHVVDHHNVLRRVVQKTVPYTPWQCFSDGCHPGRDIAGAIRRADFQYVEIEEYMQEGRGLILEINRPHIIGRAIK